MFLKKFASIALVGIAFLLLSVASGQAAVGHGGPGFGAHGSAGHFDGHHDFDHRFDGHFHRGFRGGVIIGAPYPWPVYPYDPYYEPPATYDVPAAPTYWWYCSSAGGYYPTVPACPENWVPVPAQ